MTTTKKHSLKVQQLQEQNDVYLLRKGDLVQISNNKSRNPNLSLVVNSEGEFITFLMNNEAIKGYFSWCTLAKQSLKIADNKVIYNQFEIYQFENVNKKTQTPRIRELYKQFKNAGLEQVA